MRRGRWSDLSLRVRLTILYVGLLAGLVVLFGSLIYFNVRDVFLSTTAQRLAAEARALVDRSQAEPGLMAAAQRLAVGMAPSGVTAVILDASARPIGGEPAGRTGVPVDPAELARAVEAGDAIHYTATIDGRPTLVVLVPVAGTSGTGTGSVTIHLRLLIDALDPPLQRVRQILVAGVLSVLLLALIGGFWLTGASLDPLRRMVATCQRIAAGDFSARIRLPHRDDEIGQLGAAFDQMAERIEGTLAAHRRFVGDASHELRTPLTALEGSLEVLLRGSQDDPASVNRLVLAMHREVKRLERLSDRLLDLTRLDAPLAARTRSIDLHPFMLDLHQHLRGIAPTHDVILEPGPPVRIAADVDLLRQAFVDLVDNAAAHSPKSSSIRIGWRWEPITSSNVELWVADAGDGVTADDLPHIFEPFYRGDRSRSRRRGGSGLGLTMVRAIVRAHDGRIRAQSQPESGARFVITLPTEPSPGMVGGSFAAVGQGVAHAGSGSGPATP